MRRKKAKLPVVVAGVAGLLTLCACDAKREQCEALIRVANAEDAALKERVDHVQWAERKPEQFEALGAQLLAAGQHLGAVQVKQPELLAIRNEYKAMLERYGGYLQHAAEAIRRNDLQEIQQSASRIQNMETDQRNVVERLNGYCQR